MSSMEVHNVRVFMEHGETHQLGGREVQREGGREMRMMRGRVYISSICSAVFLHTDSHQLTSSEKPPFFSEQENIFTATSLPSHLAFFTSPYVPRSKNYTRKERKSYVREAMANKYHAQVHIQLSHYVGPCPQKDVTLSSYSKSAEWIFRYFT